MSYEQRSTQRQVSFHRREIAEGPGRGMPDQQIAIHERELQTHLGHLTMGELIQFPVKAIPKDLTV